ncbi:hypothetical protein SteCoe_192 [Stentor coeruleus]|uniref:Uncharacterized protein n=1 Tax=Stentor coeruleus TaxID=5963 RepID=A0A1R2D4N7_9CILI|nr:hypothetical protein SteCoe_192 [Stentor coeruleus]
MEKLALRKSPAKLNPILPLSPRPVGNLPMPLSPTYDFKPRSSSMRRLTEPETNQREINTLPPETRLKKEFVIKSSKDRKTPERRVMTPSKQNLQTLFKKIDQEEEKDFLDLIEHLK